MGATVPYKKASSGCESNPWTRPMAPCQLISQMQNVDCTSAYGVETRPLSRPRWAALPSGSQSAVWPHCRPMPTKCTPGKSPIVLITCNFFLHSLLADRPSLSACRSPINRSKLGASSIASHFLRPTVLVPVRQALAQLSALTSSRSCQASSELPLRVWEATHPHLAASNDSRRTCR